MNNFKKIFAIILVACSILTLTACGAKKETVTIYFSGDDYRSENMIKKVNEKYPEYEVVVEYIPTGNHAAKLLTEGTTTDCDITFDLDYGYLAALDEKGYLADLSKYDKSIYTDDAVISENFLPSCRYGVCLVIDPAALEEKGIAKPTCYEDLLDPAYKGLISWASPKASATGYSVLDSLVKNWGEEEALAYFDKLTPNVISYTSSGSGPINAIIQKEAVVGNCAIELAAKRITEGYPLEIVTFEEGIPYSLCGTSIIKGKEERKAVTDVFDYLVTELIYEECEQFVPEKIFKDKDYTLENMPENITYSQMSPITSSHKTELLDKWTH